MLLGGLSLLLVAGVALLGRAIVRRPEPSVVAPPSAPPPPPEPLAAQELRAAPARPRSRSDAGGVQPVAVTDAAAPPAPATPPAFVPTPEQEYGVRVANLDPEEIRRELAAAAAPFPGVEIRSVACIDRPCQAEAEAPDAGSLNGFMNGARHRFRDHVQFRTERRVTPDGGGERFRATMVVGTLKPAPTVR